MHLESRHAASHARRASWRRPACAALGLALAAALVVPVTPAAARPVHAPATSSAFGRTLGEWMGLYWTWALGGDQADHEGNVRFLPIPSGELVSGSFTPDDPGVLVGSLDAALAPGEAFALPVVAWIGETYDPDLGNPDDVPFDPSVFVGTHAVVTLDGEPIMDSTAGDLEDFYYGPVDFDETIVYDAPTDYGAVGAIWVQGIGFVHHPLSVGTHELALESEIILEDYNLGVRFENTWTIVVAP